MYSLPKLYVWPRIQARSIAEGVHFLRQRLGHMSKHTIVAVANNCNEESIESPYKNWPKELTGKSITENWIPCSYCIMAQMRKLPTLVVLNYSVLYNYQEDSPQGRGTPLLPPSSPLPTIYTYIQYREFVIGS